MDPRLSLIETAIEGYERHIRSLESQLEETIFHTHRLDTVINTQKILLERAELQSHRANSDAIDCSPLVKNLRAQITVRDAVIAHLMSGDQGSRFYHALVACPDGRHTRIMLHGDLPVEVAKRDVIRAATLSLGQTNLRAVVWRCSGGMDMFMTGGGTLEGLCGAPPRPIHVDVM